MTFKDSQTSKLFNNTTTRLFPTVDDLAAIEPNFLPGQSITIAQLWPHGGVRIRHGVVVDFDFTQLHITVFDDNHDAQPVILPMSVLVTEDLVGTPNGDMLTLDFAYGQLLQIHPTTTYEDVP